MRLPALRPVFVLGTCALVACTLVACGGEAPSAPPSPPAAPTDSPAAVPPATTALDTATLRQRAATALAAHRLYAPAGDNAVEDYLALREREPQDPAVGTALVDLAPYVVIGAEQATGAGEFDEASRLIDLLARMDAEAPAVPRLRQALATARSEAAALEAARIEAERLATVAAPPPAPAAPSAPAPAPRRPDAAMPAPMSPPVAARAEPRPTPAPTPASAPVPSPVPAAARDLVHRVQPRFPEAALRRRLQGEVELQVGIRADGSVESVDVLRATPPGVFDREAVLAVRRWRYAPAAGPGQARVVLQFRRPDAN